MSTFTNKASTALTILPLPLSHTHTRSSRHGNVNAKVILGRTTPNILTKGARFYFTREVFDLLYPSYGDTWPMFQGAIEMTVSKEEADELEERLKRRLATH